MELSAVYYDQFKTRVDVAEHIGLLDFPKYEYSGRLSGDRKLLKVIPARIYSVDTISQ